MVRNQDSKKYPQAMQNLVGNVANAMIAFLD